MKKLKDGLRTAFLGLILLGAIFSLNEASKSISRKASAASPCPHVIFDLPRKELEAKLQDYATYSDIEIVREGTFDSRPTYTLVITPEGCRNL